MCVFESWHTMYPVFWEGLRWRKYLYLSTTQIPLHSRLLEDRHHLVKAWESYKCCLPFKMTLAVVQARLAEAASASVRRCSQQVLVCGAGIWPWTLLGPFWLLKVEMLHLPEPLTSPSAQSKGKARFSRVFRTKASVRWLVSAFAVLVVKCFEYYCPGHIDIFSCDSFEFCFWMLLLAYEKILYVCFLDYTALVARWLRSLLWACAFATTSSCT